MLRIILSFITLFSFTSALAQVADEITDQQYYQAIEELAQYAHEKDDSYNTSQVYRQILSNAEQKGFNEAVIIPLNSFYQLENRPELQDRISNILKGLGQERPTKGFGRNLDIVANKDNECTSRCVGDILDGAAKGAGIGGSIGAGGGPAVGAAGAAGGAVIGGALGGVKCATSKECTDDSKDNGSKNKFTLPPSTESGLNAPGKIKRKSDTPDPVVDRAPSYFKGN